jgi:DNA-binding PadR family transcriptional regulator
VKDRSGEDFWWFADMEIMLLYLLDDGLLQDSGQTRVVGGLPQKLYKLTTKGREYVSQWPTT